MKDTPELLFRRGNFIAVRHEKGWWLAQLYTHVSVGSEKARIRWFDEKSSNRSEKIFGIHECNDIHRKSIICTVKVKRVSKLQVSVSTSDCKLVDKFLTECKNPTVSQISDDHKASPTSSVKRRVKKTTTKTIKKRNVKKGAVKTMLKKGKRKATTKAVAAPKRKKAKVTCYSNITIYKTNPIWDPKESIPHVAPTVNSLLFARAVMNKQYGEVDKLHKDKTTFSSECYYINDGYCNKLVTKSSWHHAVDNKDKKMITMLNKMSDDNTENRNTTGTTSLLKEVGTGTYNPASLGVEYIRPLTMARGSREGVNAFNPLDFHRNNTLDFKKIFKYAVEKGCDYQFLKFMRVSSRDNMNYNMIEVFKPAVRSNNREVAAAIAKECLGWGDTDSFNQLHYEVLAFNKGEKLSPFKWVSCHKRTNYYYGKITPIHSAALNPDVSYLKQLLKDDPQPEIADGDGYRPLHYAAIASSSAPTKFLLQQNVNPLITTTNTGLTPLMRAAIHGSAVNIKALIGHGYAQHFVTRAPGPIDTSRIVDVDLIKAVAKDAGRVSSKVSKDDDEDDDEGDDKGDDVVALGQLKKQGIGGMEMVGLKGSAQSYTALALAVEYGHYDAVCVLLDLGANPNKSTGAGKRKMAPIHIAAKYGHLEIMKCLILHGAKTRAKDRHGLTAFHYVAKYNQLHCLSWLAANIVPDANIGDSSGNTPLQYACAEGFILVVKYLVEQLKVDVTAKNSWGMSALELAVLRQQIGVVDYLLDTCDIDINFKDNSGATLIMKLCAQSMKKNCHTMKPLEYLLRKPGIDVLAVDNNGCNALHYFAIQESGTEFNYDKMLALLINHGLDINSKTNNGKTPLLLAVANKGAQRWGQTFSTNVVIIKELIKFGADIGDIRLEHNRNILQHFADIPQDMSLSVIATIETGSSPALLKELVDHRDELGMNALLIAAHRCASSPSNTYVSKYSSRNESNPKPFAWRIVERLLGSTFKSDIDSEVVERKLDDKAKCICDTKVEITHKGCPLYPYTEHGKFRTLNFMMKYGDVDDIKKILRYKPDMNFVDCTGMYPLHHTLKRGRVALIPLLLKHGAVTDVLPDPGICKDNQYLDYPVLVLAAMFCIDSVMTLVQAGACILASAPDGRNALHHIVSHYTNLHQRIKIAETLLPLIENVNEVDKDGNSYLHHAVSGVEHGSNVSIEMISTLLLMGASPTLLNSNGQAPLHFAFLDSKNNSDRTEFSDPIEVVSILTHVMDKESIKAPDFYHGFTPLHLSAMRGGSVTSMHLISHGCDIDTLDNQGNTPLTLAVNGKHQSCVLMLIEKGANIDKSVQYPIFRQEPVPSQRNGEEKEEEQKYTWLPLDEKPLYAPIVLSPSNAILYKVIFYEWQGVLFKLVDLLDQSFVPLEAAINFKKFNLAITLLLKFGKSVKPDDCNSKGQTLVHCLALSSSSELELQKRLLNMFIKFQYNLTAQDTKYKCTPLHYTCLLRKLELSKLFTKPNTVNCKDTFGRTPICALFWNTNPSDEFVRFLVKEGASLENTCDFNIHESDHPLFDYNQGAGRSDYFTSFSERYTLLIKTIIHNDVIKFQLLLQLGADINTASSKGLTPLMYAAKLNRVFMFEKLLDSATPDSFSSKSDAGKTVLHYVIFSHPEVQLRNPVILRKSVSCLTTAAALSNVLEIKDSNGKTVLDYCSLYPLYSTILGVRSKVLTNNHTAPDQEMPEQPPDFTADCEKYFLQSHQDARKEPGKLAKPDSCLSLREDECEVYQDENGVYYDMLMTKIDIKMGSHGIYNFYKMQLIKNIGKDIYLLLTKWGRIGDEGQHQETPFPTFEECKSEYMKVFKAKTRNEWTNLDNFVAHPGKYRLVSREWRYHDQYKHIEYHFREDEKPDMFDDKVFNVLLEASSPKCMQNLMKDDFKLDVAQLPFGFIKLDVIDKVESILKDIEVLVLKTDSRKEKSDLTLPTVQSEFMESTQKIYDLTNEIYQLVPQKGFSVVEVEPLSKVVAIKEWRTKLVNMRDMEIVNRIMAASQLNKTAIHPIQYIYSSIGKRITTLDPTDVVTQYLIRNMFAANYRGVQGIYRLEHDSPDQRKNGEKKILYHGVSTGALLSILKRGLQNAPYGRAYGTRFGEGIYLSDNFKKSVSYARGHKSKFVLVASVAMGKVHKHIQHSWNTPEPPKNVDTVWVYGKLQQDPEYDLILRSGDRIGMGTFKQIKRESIVCNKKSKAKSSSFTVGKLYFTDAQPSKDTTNDESNSDESNSDDEDEEDEDEDEEDNQNNTTTLIDEYTFRNLPEHNEFLVKDAANIRLEYLIQVP